MQQLTGDYQSAAASYSEALTIYEDLGLRPGEAQVMNSLGELFAETGEFVRAGNCHARALRIAQELPAPLEESRALEGIGPSKLGHSKSEAEINLRRALGIYQRLGTADTARIQEMLRDLALTEAPERA